MIRAVVSNGTFQPLEPIPAEWPDGKEVLVQEANGDSPSSPEQIDQWYRELEALCATADPDDDERLRVALAEAHQKAKAIVRHEMGLE